MSQGDSDLRDFTKLDKEALKEVARKVEARTNELIRITESVLAAKGTDRINPVIAKQIALIFNHKKTLSDFIPPPRPKTERVWLKEQGFYRKKISRVHYIASLTAYMWDERFMPQRREVLSLAPNPWKNIGSLHLCEDEVNTVYEIDEIFGVMRI